MVSVLAIAQRTLVKSSWWVFPWGSRTEAFRNLNSSSEFCMVVFAENKGFPQSGGKTGIL